MTTSFLLLVHAVLWLPVETSARLKTGEEREKEGLRELGKAWWFGKRRNDVFKGLRLMVSCHT